MALTRTAFACASFFCLLLGAVWAMPLPARIAPAAPFPAIVTQAPTLVRVAPGVQEGDYLLVTVDGPLAIHIVAVDPHVSGIRIATVLADDRLVSNGERVSAMAARTGAVAGINGDYFDINATNAPTNVVVDGGQLLRTPRDRAALVLGPDGAQVVPALSFSGTVQIGTNSAPLAAVNWWPPPDGGIALITPALGNVPPETGITLIPLTLLDGTPPFARYRAGAIADNTVTQPEGTYLAVGTQAYGPTTVPNPGDIVSVSGDLTPIGLAQISEAVGGGPILLRNGQAYADPNGPNGPTFERRIPTSGVALAPDGTIFLIEVDGRQPDESIGLLRPQFIALMLSLGATDAMAFDGGGSSTLVAREPGSDVASLLNSPSDGAERRVGDALLVYSDAPVGPPSSVAVTPASLRLLVGSSTPVEAEPIDASEHRVPPDAGAIAQYTVEPADLGSIVDGEFVARRAGRGILHVVLGSVSGAASIVVSRRPARLTIFPHPVNLPLGGHVDFVARAYDADGFPLTLPSTAVWSASTGSMTGGGDFTAGNADAIVTLQADGATASQRVTVGEHEISLDLPSPPSFATAPRGGPGSLQLVDGCRACVRLSYDFTGNERAAYANLDAALPDGTLGIAFDVDGDDSGALMRVTFVNAIDETFLVTATSLNFNGRRHVVARIPASLGNGAHVASIYVLDGLGDRTIHTAGTITLSGLSIVLPGSSSLPGSAMPRP